MSDKATTICVLAIACVVFVGLGVLFDRDLMLSPFQMGAKGQEQEKAKVLAAVRLFNAIATDLYVTDGVPKMLNELPATTALRHDLFRDIGYIRDNAQVLIYDMANLTPVSIRLNSPVTAEAIVFEEWNYQYKQKSDRTPVSRLKGLGQGFRYRLRKDRGAWIIYSWDPVKVDDPVGMSTHK
jgi:hypothetical protein